VNAAESIWKRLIAHWRGCNLEVPLAVDSSSIRTFERHFKVVLPEDMRAYFLTANGNGAEFDPELFRFWQLAELIPVHEQFTDVFPASHSERFNYPGCFIFADHSISLCDYAIQLNPSGNHAGAIYRVPSSTLTGIPLALSFTQFIEMYLSNPQSVL